MSQSRDCIYRCLKFHKLSLSSVRVDDAYILIKLAYDLGVISSGLRIKFWYNLDILKAHIRPELRYLKVNSV